MGGHSSSSGSCFSLKSTYPVPEKHHDEVFLEPQSTGPWLNKSSTENIPGIHAASGFPDAEQQGWYLPSSQWPDPTGSDPRHTVVATLHPNRRMEGFHLSWQWCSQWVTTTGGFLFPPMAFLLRTALPTQPISFIKVSLSFVLCSCLWFCCSLHVSSVILCYSWINAS